jgi:hypothetical protein
VAVAELAEDGREKLEVFLRVETDVEKQTQGTG